MKKSVLWNIITADFKTLKFFFFFLQCKFILHSWGIILTKTPFDEHPDKCNGIIPKWWKSFEKWFPDVNAV